MSKRQFETALIITGDGSGGARAIKMTREQLAQLSKVGKVTQQDLHGLDGRMGHVVKKMGALASQSGVASAALAALKTAAVAAAAAIAGAGAYLGGATSSVLALGKELKMAEQQLGVSAQAMQTWGLAGDRLGISMEKMRDIFKDTSDKLGDFVATGGGEAKDIVEKLGLNVQKLNAMQPQQVLLEIGSALNNVKDISQHEKIFLLEALANDASMLLPLLEDNGALLEEVRQKAELRGQIISPNELAMLKQANDKLTESKAAFAGLKHQVGLLGAEFITLTGTGMTEYIDSLSARLRDFDLTLFVAEVEHGFLVFKEQVKQAASFISTEFQVALLQLTADFPAQFETLNQTWESFKTGASTAFKAVAGFATTYYQQIVGLWQGEITLGQAFINLKTSARQSFESIAQLAEGSFTRVKGSFLYDTLAHGVSRAFQDIQGIWQEAVRTWDSLKQRFSTSELENDQRQGWGNLRGMVESYTNFMSARMEQAWSVVVGTTKVALKVLQGDFQGAFALIQSGVQTFIQNLQSSFQNLSGQLLPEDLATMGSDILKGLGTVVTDALPALGKAFQDVMGLAQELRETIWHDWDSITAVTSYTWDAIKNIISTVWNLAVNSVTTGLRLLRGDFSGAWESFKTMTSTFIDDMATLFGGLLDPLKDLPTKALDMGKNILTGLKNGISDTASSAVDAVTDTAKSMVNKAASFLGIQSPSRLMHEMGVNINQGLAEGIQASTVNVTTAANQLAQSVTTHISTVQESSGAFSAVGTAADQTAQAIDQLRGAYQQDVQASQARIDASKAGVEALTKQRQAESEYQSEVIKATGAVSGLTNATGQGTQASGKATASKQKLTEAQKLAKKAAEELEQAQQRITDQFTAATQKQAILTETLKHGEAAGRQLELRYQSLHEGVMLLSEERARELQQLEAGNKAIEEQIQKREAEAAAVKKAQEAVGDSAEALAIAQKALRLNDEQLRALTLSYEDGYTPALAKTQARNEALAKAEEEKRQVLQAATQAVADAENAAALLRIELEYGAEAAQRAALADQKYTQEQINAKLAADKLAESYKNQIAVKEDLRGLDRQLADTQKQLTALQQGGIKALEATQREQKALNVLKDKGIDLESGLAREYRQSTKALHQAQQQLDKNKKAAENYLAVQDDLKGLTRKLADEQRKLTVLQNQGKTALERHNVIQAATNQLKDKGIDLSSDLAREYINTQQKLAAVAKAQADYNQLLQDGQSVYQATRTDTEKLAAETGKLERLVEHNIIDQDTYQRALKAVREQLDPVAKATAEYAKESQNLKDKIKVLEAGLYGNEEAARRAELGLKGYNDEQIAGIIQDEARIASLQQTGEQFDELAKAAEKTSASINQSLTDAFLSGDFKSIGNSLVDIFTNDIAKPIMDRVFKPLSDSISDSFSNIGNSISSALGGSNTLFGSTGGGGGILSTLQGGGLNGALMGGGLGMMAGQLFGQTSVGSGIGGAVGSLFGPLGTAAGSLLGGLVESLFGGKQSIRANFGQYADGGDGRDQAVWYHTKRSPDRHLNRESVFGRFGLIDGSRSVGRDDERRQVKAIHDALDAMVVMDEAMAAFIPDTEAGAAAIEKVRQGMDGFKTNALDTTSLLRDRTVAIYNHMSQGVKEALQGLEGGFTRLPIEDMAARIEFLAQVSQTVQPTIEALGLKISTTWDKALRDSVLLTETLGGTESAMQQLAFYAGHFVPEGQLAAQALENQTQRLHDFNASLGLSGDAAIDTTAELYDYVQGLNLSGQAGRDAAAAAFEHMEAVLAVAAANEESALKLSTVSEAARLLNLNFEATSPAASGAASALIELMGGLESFTSATQNYYSQFYSQEEQQQLALANAASAVSAFNDSLGLTGQAAIDTAEEFRHYVESLDLTTEEGRQAFAAAMDLSDAMAAVADSGLSLNELIDTLPKNLQGAFELMNAGSLATAETLEASAEAVESAAVVIGAASASASQELDALGGAITSVADSAIAAALQASNASFDAIKSSEAAMRAAQDAQQATQAAARAQPSGPPVPAYASGGWYPGGLALVGEHGPELINFSQPGYVYDADETRQLLDQPPQPVGVAPSLMDARPVFNPQARQRDNAIVQELRALRGENQKLRQAVAELRSERRDDARTAGQQREQQLQSQQRSERHLKDGQRQQRLHDYLEAAS